FRSRLYADQDAIISSLAQPQEHLRVVDQISMHGDAWISLGKPENDIRQKCEPRRFHAADPYFSSGRVGQEFDVPDALLQLVENRDAAFKEHVTVDRWLDASRAAVEKPYSKRVFEIGDHLRNGGMGN